ncbi:hypothetical protein [Pseudoxanthomonas putridarboris]|uniref:Uncharacterized protein n=1 Tax=Pseudoxanthomonas putridarboris TaxID=752605 RepID=A0ABU9IW52_9GAMM
MAAMLYRHGRHGSDRAHGALLRTIPGRRMSGYPCCATNMTAIIAVDAQIGRSPEAEKASLD